MTTYPESVTEDGLTLDEEENGGESEIMRTLEAEILRNEERTKYIGKLLNFGRSCTLQIQPLMVEDCLEPAR